MCGRSPAKCCGDFVILVLTSAYDCERREEYHAGLALLASNPRQYRDSATCRVQVGILKSLHHMLKCAQSPFAVPLLLTRWLQVS